MPVRRTARVAAWSAAAVLGLAGVATAVTNRAGSAGSVGTLALFGAPVTAGSAGASTTPSPSPSPGATGSPHRPDRPGRAFGMPLHGTFVTQDSAGTFHTRAVQRGTVTAASATSISVRSADGFTDTYAVTSSTRVVKDFRQVQIGEIKVNDTVMVMAEVQGSTKTAGRVAELSGTGWRDGGMGRWDRHGRHHDGLQRSGSGSTPSAGGPPAPPLAGDLPA